MNCATCNKEAKNSISAAGHIFCSDVCHLLFWQKEMPNLGGEFISNDDIKKLDSLQGPEREAFYSKIVNFIMDNIQSSKFIQKIK